MLNKFNENLAKKLTMIFGTMWTCYAFLIYGLLSLIPQLSQYQDNLMYWSNWLQLWSLPLILVGQNLLNKDSEKRAQDTHDIVKEQISYIKDIHAIELAEMNHMKKEMEMELEQQKSLTQIISQLKDEMEMERQEQENLAIIMLKLKDEIKKE